ncbi:hypothetical protein PhCBS80983_g02760 [Powellomyces hirtus]|uniref:DOC domain-containing protein n=1 Tax=Powellomyces hirtus TaxID=109895 RepID=A0A507E6Q6_9FUNG|nr:hypothetical protein PhCBS80983_g02760 [Powellomyces hirtus]
MFMLKRIAFSARRSDGPQPHFINLEFSQKMTLTKLSIYVDHGRDESYTPREIAVRAGNSFYDLQDVQRFEIGEDTGWVDFVLCEDEDTTRPLRAFLVQICILENYQHGKDTHVRGLKIWAPSLRLDMMVPEMPPFSTLEYQMQVLDNSLNTPHSSKRSRPAIPGGGQ